MKIQYETPSLSGLGFGRLTSLQNELNRLFDGQHVWAPVLDVQEDKNEFRVRVEIPGLKREDIEVSIDDGALVISGERKVETVAEGTDVLRQERHYGKFSRALTLPSAVAADKIKASYKDGVLAVTLPKAEEAKPRTITVGE